MPSRKPLTHIIRLLSSIWLCWCQPQLLLAADQTPPLTFSQLENQMLQATALPVSAELLNGLAQRFDQFQSQNASQLSANASLQAKFAKLKNYVALRARFQNCLQNHSDPNGLGMRILNAAENLKPTASDCALAKKGLMDLTKEVQGSLTHDFYLRQEQNLIRQIQINATTAIADALYHVQDQAQSIPAVAALAAATVCQTGCNADTRAQLKSAALIQLQNSSAEGPPLGSQAAADLLNSKLADINHFAQTPFADADKASDVSREIEKNYWSVASSGIGLFLNTDTLVDKTGVPDSLGEADMPRIKKNSGGSLSLDLMSLPTNLSAFDIKKARQQYINQMATMGAQVASLESEARLASQNGATNQDIEKRKNEIKDLIKSNPVATAQLVLSDPQAAQMICQFINQIEKTDAKMQSKRKTNQWWGMIAGGTMIGVGVAASFTGVGGLVGMPLAAMGAGLTGWDLKAAGVRALQAQRDLKTISQSQLGGNTDALSLHDEKKDEQKISDSAVEASVSLGLTALGSATVLRGIGKFASRLKDTKLIQNIHSNLQALKGSSDILYIKTSLGESLAAEFTGELSNLSPKALAEVRSELAAMTAQGATPAELRAFISQVEQRFYRLCESCGKS